jgi:hypothetical protein
MREPSMPDQERPLEGDPVADHFAIRVGEPAIPEPASPEPVPEQERCGGSGKLRESGAFPEPEWFPCPGCPDCQPPGAEERWDRVFGLRCAELGGTPGERHDFVLLSDADRTLTEARREVEALRAERSTVGEQVGNLARQQAEAEAELAEARRERDNIHRDRMRLAGEVERYREALEELSASWEERAELAKELHSGAEGLAGYRDPTDAVLHAQKESYRNAAAELRSALAKGSRDAVR